MRSSRFTLFSIRQFSTKSRPVLPAFIMQNVWNNWTLDAKGVTTDYLLTPANNGFLYDDFLNHSAKSIVALGVGTDGYVPRYREKGWQIAGYDYTPASHAYMRMHGVKPRIYDLNAMNQDQQPVWAKNLQGDLAQPTNILSFRLLQYLNDEARRLLLFHLIDHAKSGSVFLLMNAAAYTSQSTDVSREERREQFSNQCIEQYYTLSFFAPRTDFDIQYCESVQTDHHRLIKAQGMVPQDCEYSYEFMVMKKR